MKYSITHEQCKAMITGVCPGCGGELIPFETEDNAGNPIFWSGCKKCSSFNWGVPVDVFKTAQDMVLNQGYVHYSHMGRREAVSGAQLQYWESSQILGTCSLVAQVLNTHKLITHDTPRTLTAHPAGGPADHRPH